jgi:RNA polymerase primary sigma factor
MKTPATTRILSRSREIELARSIEGALLEQAGEIAGSPEAMRALGNVLEQAKRGPDAAAELFLGFGSDWIETESALEQLTAIVLRMEQRKDSGPPHDEVRAEFVSALLRARLSRQGVEQLVRELRARSQTRRRGQATLSRTISTLARCREAYDRAKATLVQANLGLVFSMANRRSHPGLSLEDLVQEGTMGLMRAVDGFDHRRGIKFGTYAAWWIRHAINRALSDYARTIRVPVHVLDAHFKLRRAAQQLVQQNGREPTEAELSKQTGLSPEKIGLVASIPPEPMSLDAPMWEDGDARLGDVLPDLTASSPLEGLSTKQAQLRLRHLLKALTPREEEVIRLRFGIDCPESQRLEQVGRQFGLSRERIRQIEATALSKLHRRAASEELDSLMTG